MRTLLKYVLPVLFAALLSGCGASLARKVRIGEEVAVRQYGTVGLDLTFDVENASRRTLRLEEAELEFFTGAGSLEVEVRMTLRAGAVRRRVSFERMPFSEFLNIFAEDRMRLG